MTAFVRIYEEKLFFLICISAAILTSLIFFAILWQILLSGIASLTWYFITTPESKTPHIGMGIANAIVGTIIISICATTLAIPTALGTAIYLQKYATNKRLAGTFRFFLEVLSGTPSIVIGMFGFLFFVYYLKSTTGGFSLISGSLALSILIMPVIERSIEEAISKVPHDMEEASYALGATKWKTIRDVSIPIAMSGIITGAILGFGRAAEESAVVILTAGYSQFMPEFTVKSNEKLLFGIKIYPIQDLVGTLPYSVYHAYENSNVIPRSNAFAAALVLIVFVLIINVTAKGIIVHFGGLRPEGFIARMQKKIITEKSRNSWTDIIRARLFPQKKEPETIIIPYPSKKSPEDLIKSMMPSSKKPETDTAGSMSLQKRIAAIFSSSKKKPEPVTVPQGAPQQNNSPSPKKPARTFLRALLPFAIPAVLLLLIALFATIPPLHHAFSSVSSSDALLLIIGPILIVMIAGLYLGFLLVSRSGIFKGKSRRVGYAGVAAGICLICIAGIICAMAAPGVFSTGDQPATKSTADRMAQLAALTAEYEAKEDGTSVTANILIQSSSASVQPSSTSSIGVMIPAKDALSVGESYQYGDATRTVQATVYDYKVLPFYFWWFIDYNRFVQQVPHYGNQYLVVFIRMENTGTNSAIVPSADMIHVSNNGNVYSHKPYFNTSVLSSYQSSYYADHYDQLPYQWIREIGPDMRDYAYVTGYNIFGDSTNNSVSNPIVTETITVTPTTSTNASSATNGKGFFIKPGPGNAVDGYLIFEVPNSVVKQNIDKTYVDISFNANSGTRWRLVEMKGK